MAREREKESLRVRESEKEREGLVSPKRDSPKPRPRLLKRSASPLRYVGMVLFMPWSVRSSTRVSLGRAFDRHVTTEGPQVNCVKQVDFG